MPMNSLSANWYTKPFLCCGLSFTEQAESSVEKLLAGGSGKSSPTVMNLSRNASGGMAPTKRPGSDIPEKD